LTFLEFLNNFNNYDLNYAKGSCLKTTSIKTKGDDLRMRLFSIEKKSHFFVQKITKPMPKKEFEIIKLKD